MSGVLHLTAQDFVDNALLYSRLRPGGSARVQAVGGAQVALGGDYSSGFSNPAGLGKYNRSEITLSTGLNFSSSKSSYFGTSTSDSKSTFNIPGFSIVFNRPCDDCNNGYVSGSFAITLTRTNDFNQNFQYSGENNSNSIVDYFINDAGNIDPDEMLDQDGSYYYSLTSLAYRNYLIEDFDDNGNIAYGSLLNFSGGRQTEVSERKGAQYQWSLAYGANFADKFYAGASIGINTLRFKLNQQYSESDFDYPDDERVEDFNISEEYDIRGSGVNLTLGFIYRPVDFLQIGASFVTPTYYSITDSYKAGVQSNWSNFDYYPEDPDDEPLNFVSDEFDQPLLYEYNVTTPLRFSTGMTLFSEFGFITTDIEFVNYQKAKYSSDIAGEFKPENNSIKTELNSVINYRIGAEFKKDIYRVRAGFSRMSEPYAFNESINRSVNSFTGGVGLRWDKFYVDMAVISSKTEGSRIPYFVDSNNPEAKLEFSNLDFVLTAGVTF
jgi:hypothetical protein